MQNGLHSSKKKERDIFISKPLYKYLFRNKNILSFFYSFLLILLKYQINMKFKNKKPFAVSSDKNIFLLSERNRVFYFLHFHDN